MILVAMFSSIPLFLEISEKSAAENEDSPSKPVLKDLPSPTFGTSPADNICGNLQLLFALMKYSEKRFG